MAVTLPTQHGLADWQNYQDYWREEDAEWLQARSILRYASSATRSSEWSTPSAGHVTYNQATDQLEHFTATAPAKWIGVLASQHLAVTPKTSASDSDPVVLGHRGASGGGLQFFPTVATENKVALTNAYLDIGGGAIVAKPTGLTVTATTTLATTVIKTGAKTATLTTSATDLVSDSPITAPSATIANITMSGTLSGSGIVNGASGTIGGVALGTTAAHGSGGVRADAQGLHAQGGAWYGNSTSAIMRYRNPSGGAYGTAYFEVNANDFGLNGRDAYFSMALRMMAGRGVIYYRSDNAVAYTGGPVIYGGDPNVGLWPEGTIWVS